MFKNNSVHEEGRHRRLEEKRPRRSVHEDGEGDRHFNAHYKC